MERHISGGAGAMNITRVRNGAGPGSRMAGR